jgi:hypothetical protein
MNSAYLDKSCSSGTSRETAFLTVRVSSFMLSVAAAVWPAPYCASARSVYQRAHRFSVAVKTQRPVVSPVAVSSSSILLKLVSSYLKQQCIYNVQTMMCRAALHTLAQPMQYAAMDIQRSKHA